MKYVTWMMSDFMILDGWLVIKVSIDKRSRAHPRDLTLRDVI